MITFITIKKEEQVEIPSIPKFIKVGKKWWSIKDFTEDELKTIGKAWLENFVAKSN